MVLALIIISGVIGYGFIGGLTYSYFRTHFASYDGFGEAMAATFWPVALPAGVGVVLTGGGKAQKKSRLNRTEKRRAKEIEEAQHRKHLAQIAAEELAINERSLNIN